MGAYPYCCCSPPTSSRGLGGLSLAAGGRVCLVRGRRPVEGPSAALDGRCPAAPAAEGRLHRGSNPPVCGCRRSQSRCSFLSAPLPRGSYLLQAAGDLLTTESWGRPR